MSTFPGIILAVVLLCATGSTASKSSRQETNAGRPSFEVATIKPSSMTRHVPGGPSASGAYFAWQGTTLSRLLSMAYFLPYYWKIDWQMKGGQPGWVDSQLWDVEARPRPEDVEPNPRGPITQPTKFMLMLQSLLEDRFKLQVERQTREAPVYNLVIAKGGLKMKADEELSLPSRPGAGTPPPSGGTWEAPRGNLTINFRNRPPYNRSLEGRAVPMEKLVHQLLSFTDRPIIDRTNLKGLYNIRIGWSSEDAGSGDSPLTRMSPSVGPEFFRALQEQLGLRLESAKGPVDFLVIKSVQKPSGK
jgi:uncharacterized protein (TIGR03435 family)